MEPVQTLRNPFEIAPPCAGYVPGFGDRTADFHVIRDRPAVADSDTGPNPLDHPSAEKLRNVLDAVELLEAGRPSNLFCSYRYPCQDPFAEQSASTEELEAIFDAELRAVTAHVLVPIGTDTIETVLEQYSTVNPDTVEADAVHATELASGSWIILPLKEPSEWDTTDETAAREAFEDLLSRDYRREADLGRLVTGPESYLVR